MSRSRWTTRGGITVTEKSWSSDDPVRNRRIHTCADLTEQHRLNPTTAHRAALKEMRDKTNFFLSGRDLYFTHAIEPLDSVIVGRLDSEKDRANVRNIRSA